MFEEFTNQILLTPTVYRILKKDAKLNRTSARVRLDIILRDFFSKEISEEENEDDGLFNGLEPEPEPELKPVAKTWHQIYMGQTGRKKMSMYEAFMEYGQDPLTSQ